MLVQKNYSLIKHGFKNTVYVTPVLQVSEKTLDEPTFQLIVLIRKAKSSSFGKVFKYFPEILYNKIKILNFV